MNTLKKLSDINFSNYDAVIVGAGFAGTVIAERLSNKYGFKVLVLEKRSHVGGNAYDEYDENGFLIQKYGPHIFFTDLVEVLDYVSNFCNLVQHDVVMLSYFDGKYVQLPFNFKSVEQMMGYRKARKVIDGIKNAYPCSKRISIFDLMNDPNDDVSEFGNLLYKKAFETYICKQWGLKPEQISKDVINRCKFSPNYTNRYLDRDFHFLPDKGFTVLMENMLTNDHIDVCLNYDANEHIKIHDNKIFIDGKEFSNTLVYTGPIDELFSYKYGKLPYRSMYFVTEYFDEERKLAEEIVSMPQDPKVIRKTEYKYFSPFIIKEREAKTVVVSEEPYQYDYKPDSIMCYPVINDTNIGLFEKYNFDAKKVNNLVMCGRLAEYKYFNMDMIISNSLKMSDEVAIKIKGNKWYERNYFSWW